MGALLLRRLIGVVPLLLLVSFGVFLLITLVPGDAAMTLAGGENATPERIAEVQKELGLDKPLVVQYGRWLKGAVHLDFGRSLISGRPVTEDIQNRFPVTFSIALSALVLGLLIGVPAGIVAGMRPGTMSDRASVFLASAGLAVPNFWLAMVLIAVFAVNLHWLPAIGFIRFTESPLDWLRSVILPACALGVLTAATVARQLRAALIDELSSSYVRTAWAKGSGATRVVGKHALKNAAMPAVTILGLQLTQLLGGAVIIEKIFSIQGLGTYLLSAVLSTDLPVVEGVVVVFVLIHVLLSLLVDISYGFLNPKARVT